MVQERPGAELRLHCCQSELGFVSGTCLVGRACAAPLAGKVVGLEDPHAGITIDGFCFLDRSLDMGWEAGLWA